MRKAMEGTFAAVVIITFFVGAYHILLGLGLPIEWAGILALLAACALLGFAATARA